FPLLHPAKAVPSSVSPQASRLRRAPSQCIPCFRLVPDRKFERCWDDLKTTEAVLRAENAKGDRDRRQNDRAGPLTPRRATVWYHVRERRYPFRLHQAAT